jgi:diaminohydroxyphosphoribosylaminopyrimidine deaminase/5-amino-6-(5-phosphoribosylamino)uracil reductase
LAAVMHEFARRGWSKVLIEGGARLAGSALKAGIVDRVAFFIAPLIIGSGLASVEGLLTGTVRQANKLENVNARRIGTDWLLEGDVVTRSNRRRQGL